MTNNSNLNDSRLIKDFQKLRSFYIQSVVGPFMAYYRQLKEIPINSTILISFYAKYYNDIHIEVITGEDNDEYIRNIFEDIIQHHSINCITNILFQFGSVMLQQLCQINYNFNPNDQNNFDPERLQLFRNFLSSIVDQYTPDFNEVFSHTCSGQSIDELKEEVRTGTYIPPFTIKYKNEGE